MTGYWSGVKHDTQAVLCFCRLLSDSRAVEPAGWPTDVEKGCMEMESDWRTPTEHVQCTSTKITSDFIRFTRQTFSFPDKLSLVTSFWGTLSAWCKSSSCFSVQTSLLVEGLGFYFLPALCKAPHCGLHTSGPLPPTTHHVVINPIRILRAIRMQKSRWAAVFNPTPLVWAAADPGERDVRFRFVPTSIPTG